MSLKEAWSTAVGIMMVVAVFLLLFAVVAAVGFPVVTLLLGLVVAAFVLLFISMLLTPVVWLVGSVYKWLFGKL